MTKNCKSDQWQFCKFNVSFLKHLMQFLVKDYFHTMIKHIVLLFTMGFHNRWSKPSIPPTGTPYLRCKTQF